MQPGPANSARRSCEHRGHAGRTCARNASRHRDGAEADRRRRPALLSDPMSREAFAIMNRDDGAVPTGSAAPPWAARRRPSRRAPELAPVPARLHAAQSRRPGRPARIPTGDRRPAVLPDRRRQDRGLSRPRRLRDRASPPRAIRACRAPGCRVIMRYTLRLLTLDQLAARRRPRLRAGAGAARAIAERLGTWPIEIGLWVGGGATPNTLGGTQEHARRARPYTGSSSYRRGRGPAPAPLKACPWCGTTFDARQLSPPSRHGMAPAAAGNALRQLACDFSGRAGCRSSWSTRRSIAACRPS